MNSPNVNTSFFTPMNYAQNSPAISYLNIGNVSKARLSDIISEKSSNNNSVISENTKKSNVKYKKSVEFKQASTVEIKDNSKSYIDHHKKNDRVFNLTFNPKT